MDVIEDLLGQLGNADAPARETAQALVRAVLDFHAEGVTRILGTLRAKGGDAAVEAIAEDEAVGAMLLLHGLHPVPLARRAQRAVDDVESDLRRCRTTATMTCTGEAVLVRTLGPRGEGARAASLVTEAMAARAPDAQVTVEQVFDDSSEGLIPAARLTGRRAEGSLHSNERDKCELCGTEIADAHEHLVDPKARELRCVCPTCGAGHQSRGLGGWKHVPPRAELLDGFRLSDGAWDALGIPIGLAFFVKSGEDGRVVAQYPGPAGATESLLSMGAWKQIEDDNAVLRDLAPDVEALLVHRAGSTREHYRVSIDACYALVGQLRRHWRGLSGGRDAWARVSEFFEDLKVPAERAARA